MAIAQRRPNSAPRKSPFPPSCRKRARSRSTQLLTLSEVTPKADLGFMLVTPDLQTANRIEKQLTLSLGADVLVPVYSYLSLTEESEYTTTDEQWAQTLESEQQLKSGTPEFEAAMNAFRERMKQYRHERVYPTLPDWPIVCFYNMTKRRGEHATGIPALRRAPDR